ncbi:hypothetical protein BJ742DRAFT_101062 [Cladochytrium replicatum]|nr:hypothetical protein BJ742DRAFT_101062 [Cladochytrium replicatum]
MDSKHRWERADEADSPVHTDLPPPEYSTLAVTLQTTENGSATTSSTPLRTQTTYTSRIGFVPSNPSSECTLNPGDLIYVEGVSKTRPGWVFGFNVTTEGSSPKGPMRLLPWACLNEVEDSLIDLPEQAIIAGAQSSSAGPGNTEGLGTTAVASVSSRSIRRPSLPLIINAFALPAPETLSSVHEAPQQPPAMIEKKVEEKPFWSPTTLAMFVAVAILIIIAGVVGGWTLVRSTGSDQQPGASSSTQTATKTLSAYVPSASPTGGNSLAQQCTSEAYFCEDGNLFTCDTQLLKWIPTTCAAEAIRLGSSALSVPATCVNGIGVFGVQRNHISGVNVCPCKVANSYCLGDSMMVKCTTIEGQSNGVFTKKSCGGPGSCTSAADMGKEANCGAGNDQLVESV